MSGWKMLVCGLLSVAALMAAPPAPKSVRVYVFDCGTIKGLDPAIFHFKKEELAGVDFVVACYLVVHPRGTLMWDVGVIPDSAFKEDGKPVTQGVSTVTRPLLPQLANLGYTPADISYLGLSHYHSDHTANANAFAGSTWLVHQAERDAMFAEKPAGIIQQASFLKLKDSKTKILPETDYDKLKDSKTKILPETDYDVFGDGTVVIKYAPGHTPGHQVLLLKLKKYGPVLIAGDLYHYPEERFTEKTPTFEFNHEQSLASRAKMEGFIKQNKAHLWIEHDMATFNKLEKAPQFYE